MQLSQLERVCGADLRSLRASRAQKGLSTGLMLAIGLIISSTRIVYDKRVKRSKSQVKPGKLWWSAGMRSAECDWGRIRASNSRNGRGKIDVFEARKERRKKKKTTTTTKKESV